MITSFPPTGYHAEREGARGEVNRMEDFISSFFAALIGFAIGHGIFDFVVWLVRKSRVKSTPEQEKREKS